MIAEVFNVVQGETFGVGNEPAFRKVHRWPQVDVDFVMVLSGVGLDGSLTRVSQSGEQLSMN